MKYPKSPKAVLVLIVLFSVASILFKELEIHPVYAVLKPITTVLIILYAYLISIRKKATYRLFILLALSCCLIGDILLIKEEWFVYGLAGFLIAHVMLVAAFINKRGIQVDIIPLLFLVVIGIIYYTFLLPQLGNMEIPVGVYIAVILFMCWQGLIPFFKKKTHENSILAAAVLLFLLSDATIAYQKFIFDFKLSSTLILSTYWMSIVFLARTLGFQAEEISLKDVI